MKFEQPPSVLLEKRRFKPTKESVEYMKAFREIINDLKKEIPEIRGIGFFGSRTRGQEYREKDRKSDLDMIIFFNGEHLLFESAIDELKRTNKPIPEGYQNIYKVLDNIHEKIQIKLKALHLPGDEDGGSVIYQDISEKYTHEILSEFVSDAERALKANEKPWEDEEWLNDPIGRGHAYFELAIQFFMGVGKELYKNRSRILDELNTLPDGDQYFKFLMEYLQYIEREKSKEKRPETPQYNRLPTTIDEARNFFLTMPNLDSIDTTKQLAA